MRNGQNKQRMRNRNNNNQNRRGQNPLTRVYESNGPDIKIRGTASHIAEKYVQLARDARSSGDPVAAAASSSLVCSAATASKSSAVQVNSSSGSSGCRA